MNASLLRRFAVMLAIITSLGIIAPAAAWEDGVTEQSPSGGVSQVESLATAHALFDRVFNNESADAASLLIADDAVLHTTRFGDWTGPQGVLDYVAFVKRAYPDAAFTLNSVSLSGDSTILTWTMTASQLQMDPVELPYAVDVRIDGSAVIAMSDSRIADIDLSERTVAIRTPQSIAYQPQPGLPGQPY